MAAPGAKTSSLTAAFLPPAAVAEPGDAAAVCEAVCAGAAEPDAAATAGGDAADADAGEAAAAEDADAGGPAVAAVS